MYINSEYKLNQHNRTPDLKDPQTKTKVLIKYKKSLRNIYRNLHRTATNNIDGINSSSAVKD
jgi:hypothetical protein